LRGDSPARFRPGSGGAVVGADRRSGCAGPGRHQELGRDEFVPKGGDHCFIDGPLEGHDDVGKLLGIDPLPLAQLGRVVGIEVDVSVGAGETHEEPGLALPFVAAAPELPVQLRREIVAELVGQLADDLQMLGAYADFFTCLADRRGFDILAFVNPALRHLPPVAFPVVDALADEDLAFAVDQHDADAGPVLGWIAFVHTVALKGSWWVIPSGALIARQKNLIAALQVGTYLAGPDGYNGARRRQDLNDGNSGGRPTGRNPGFRSGSRSRGGALRRRQRRRHAAHRWTVHAVYRARWQRSRHFPGFSGRNPRPARDVVRRLGVSDQLRLDADRYGWRRARRTRGNEPGGAQGEPRRAQARRPDHRRHRRVHQAQPRQGEV